MLLESRPNGLWFFDFFLGSRRRLGRSEALRIVGLALSTSDIVVF